MITIRRSDERGHAQHGWLDSHHTFSFADYHDPAHMGFGDLRVINEDRVEPGQGFGEHPHRDMEIITYVLDGALEHRDSMGNGSVIRPGDVQHMSAGSGIRHSEFNASREEPVHFLQIWVVPNRRGGKPRYGERHFSREERSNRLRLVASGDGREASIQITQDLDIYASVIDPEAVLRHQVRAGRRSWIHVARGTVEVAGKVLVAGDALATDEAGTISISANNTQEAEVLVFDTRGDAE